MFPGETKKQKTPIQSMENALNADANQTNENERVFVRVIVDENRPFFGLKRVAQRSDFEIFVVAKGREEKKSGLQIRSSCEEDSGKEEPRGDSGFAFEDGGG